MAQYKIAQDFVLNTQLRKLTQGNDELNLSELSYRLLVCLIEHAPNVVPHQTLHQQVWQGKVVSDDTIKKRVSRLRETLSTQDAIIAERGIGYRLNLPVYTLPEQNTAHSNNSKTIDQKPFSKNTFALIIAALLSLLGIVFMQTTYIQSTITQPNQLEINNEPSFQVSDYMDLYKKEDIDNAIDELESHLIKQPNDAIRLNLISQIYQVRYQLHQADNIAINTALKYAEKSVTHNPNQVWSHTTLAKVYLLKGDLDAAQNHIEKAMKFAPNWVDVHVLEAKLFRLKGDIKRAWQRISLVYKTHPDDENVRFERANILINKNMFGWAKSTLLALQKEGFNPPWVTLSLAELYITTKQFPVATTLLKEFIQTYPNSYHANFLLGIAYDSVGNIDSARVYYRPVAFSNNIYSETAYLLLSQNNRENEQRTFNNAMSSQTPIGQFNKALHQLISGENDAFFSSLEHAISSQFATEYLLHLNSIEQTLLTQSKEQSRAKERWQDIKQQVYYLNQNKRVKRTPMKTI